MVTLPRGRDLEATRQTLRAALGGDDVQLELTHDVEHAVFQLSALTEERLLQAARELRFAHDAPWKDPFTRTPRRAELARVTQLVAGETDPVRAWARVTTAEPRWQFVEERFVTCTSCGGSGLDPYAGACYGCTHDGKSLSEYVTAPHPPSLQHVLAFGADLPAMRAVEAAVHQLLERLAPWGVSATPQLDWLAEAPSHVRGGHTIPNCLVPVFQALRAQSKDPTIPDGGFSEGWFSQGRRAWHDVRALHPFSERADPFEPLRAILEAGYRPLLVGNATVHAHVRLSCDL